MRRENRANVRLSRVRNLDRKETTAWGTQRCRVHISISAVRLKALLIVLFKDASDKSYKGENFSLNSRILLAAFPVTTYKPRAWWEASSDLKVWRVLKITWTAWLILLQVWLVWLVVLCKAGAQCNLDDSFFFQFLKPTRRATRHRSLE